jgi:DNA (cytosine-5)-methyltransferase 1
MGVYYNEWEPYPAQWLRNLIKAGHLPEGDVDERDIRTIQAEDLKGYDQCHFFAGIGGWPLALRLAGWGERSVWTGSCPCQPFSSAGEGNAQSDERHLWPDWYRLIRERKPPTVFGEQVEKAIAYGWLDDVFNDLEKETYACASNVLPSYVVGGRDRRNRIWFVAHSGCVVGTQSIQSSKHVEFDGRKIKKVWRENRVIPKVASIRREILEKRLDKSKTYKLVDGIQFWPSQLRAHGNAINPYVAQAFIEAFMECRP